MSKKSKIGFLIALTVIAGFGLMVMIGASWPRTQPFENDTPTHTPYIHPDDNSNDRETPEPEPSAPSNQGDSTLGDYIDSGVDTLKDIGSDLGSYLREKYDENRAH